MEKHGKSAVRTRYRAKVCVGLTKTALYRATGTGDAVTPSPPCNALLIVKFYTGVNHEITKP